MKKLGLSFWLGLTAASLLIIQAASPYSQVRQDDPAPTCPPLCPPAGEGLRR